VSFLTVAALFASLLVGLPLAAHLLRRRHAEERFFPPTVWLSATPPNARRRSRIEDRALLIVRILGVLGLTILGATPFVSCSHLALERRGGASVAIAIVVDDSLSMRALAGETTRIELARQAALDLIDGARAGDAFAIVLAGSPPRVALAPTTDLAAVRDAASRIVASDRATDVEGATRLGRDLVAHMPQPDRRVVLLSDLRDGRPDAPELAGDAEVSLWFPLTGLAAPVGGDCAILGASRTGARGEVRLACAAGDGGAAGPSPSEGRTIVIRREGDREALVKLPLPAEVTIAAYTLDLPPVADEAVLVAEIDGKDAIASDDRATLSAAGAELSIGVVSDTSATQTETGGPPPLEQGFAALGLGASIKPFNTTPDEERDLGALGALVIDDPPGFTPEQRRALSSWLDKGGTLLVTLGPTAAAAPLGSTFAGILPGVVRWGASPALGVSADSAGTFGVSARGLSTLAPKGRATIDAEAATGGEVLAAWTDGAPLLIRRRVGRGSVLVSTLPLSTEQSDFALRPAFLALLERVAELSRAASGNARVDVGQAIALEGFKDVKASYLAPSGEPPVPVEIRGDARGARLEPGLAGRYELVLDGATSMRTATVPAREIDLRPRKVADGARAKELGGEAPHVDASPYVAVFLLALFALETALRVFSGRRKDELEPAVPTAS